MADVSEWSANEKENTHIDELTLSGEGGMYINKTMCAVKKKFDEVNDSVVHKKDDETIDGTKTFKKDITVNKQTPKLVLKGTTNEYCDIRGMSGELFHSMLRFKSSRIELGLRPANVQGGTLDGSHIVLDDAGVFTICAQLGLGSTPFSLVGSPDGTLEWNGQSVQTSSDERIKTPIDCIPDDILDAWGNVKWGQFKYLDAVAKKGASEARLHTGLVAQNVQEAFSSLGLDACVYGVLCHKVKEAEDYNISEVVNEAYIDKHGIEHPAVVQNEHVHKEAVDLWMVRYAEALCLEAAYQRRCVDRILKKIETLEARLNGIN